MGKVFQLDFEVRDYELDQYGVVNNAVYLNYLEHTRHAFLTEVGMDAAEVAASGKAIALSAIELRFRASLRSHDAFQVHLVLSELTGARAVLGQRILRLPEQELILEARAVAVFLDERGRPMRISPDYRERFLPFLAEEAGATGGARRRGGKT